MNADMRSCRTWRATSHRALIFVVNELRRRRDKWRLCSGCGARHRHGSRNRSSVWGHRRDRRNTSLITRVTRLDNDRWSRVHVGHNRRKVWRGCPSTRRAWNDRRNDRRSLLERLETWRVVHWLRHRHCWPLSLRVLDLVRIFRSFTGRPATFRR